MALSILQIGLSRPAPMIVVRKRWKSAQVAFLESIISEKDARRALLESIISEKDVTISEKHVTIER